MTHIARAPTGSYGAEFSTDMLDLLALSLNTTFFVDNERLAIFTTLLLDGQQWMTTPVRAPSVSESCVRLIQPLSRAIVAFSGSHSHLLVS